MEKMEFPGELQDIAPSTLLGDESGEVDEFFLVLALIYDDLKSITFLGYIKGEIYREPEKGEISAHAGESYGLTLFQNKLTASLINEFLLFLSKNKHVLTQPLFQRVLLKMNKSQRNYWYEIQKLALTGEEPSKTSYVYTLARIRNNIGFHYDHSKQELKRAFISYFRKADKDKTQQNARAYFSLEDTMRDSRFYYVDAAAIEYMDMRAKEVEGKKGESFAGFNDYARKLGDTSASMNRTILALMHAYLSLKKGTTK